MSKNFRKFISTINTDDIQDIQEWLFNPDCIAEFTNERKARLFAARDFIRECNATGKNWLKYVELGTRHKNNNQKVSLKELEQLGIPTDPA